MSTPSRQRLFPQQIRALALADIVFSLASSMNDLGSFSQHKVLKGEWCNWNLHILRFGTFASVLVELHISLGFAFQMFKCVQLLRFLRGSLVAIIPASLLLTVFAAFAYKIVTSSKGGCMSKGDKIFPFVLAFTFVVSMCTYGVTAYRACSANEAVARRSWSRAAVYLLNFLVTQALIFLRSTPIAHTFTHTHAFLVLALTMQNLNGFVNALTYAMQSRYASSLSHDNNPLAHEINNDNSFTYNVAFGGVTLVDISYGLDAGSTVSDRPLSRSTTSTQLGGQETEASKVTTWADTPSLEIL